MSAEPQRKAPYLIDLRLRVVWQRLGKDLSFNKISKNLNIAASTACRIYCEFECKGHVLPSDALKQPRRELRKLDDYMELFIIGLVLESPGLYLREICDKVKVISGIQVSECTVCRILHRHGCSRKRIRYIAT